jgi:ElaB/YqjD/DUF883 family membrane-anchored ribosome-binding protein
MQETTGGYGSTGGYNPDDASRAESVERMARQAADRAAEAVRSGKERLNQAYDRTVERAERAYDGAMGYAREHPGTTALVSLGAGIGIGIALASGSNGFRTRRNSFPAMASAVADAVIAAFDRRR